MLLSYSQMKGVVCIWYSEIHMLLSAKALVKRLMIVDDS